MEGQPGIGTQIVELMRDSVITQAAVTIIVTVATVGLLWEGKPVPGELWALDGLVVGFYFGGKVQSGAARLVDRHVAKIGALIAERHWRDGADGPSTGSGRSLSSGSLPQSTKAQSAAHRSTARRRSLRQSTEAQSAAHRSTAGRGSLRQSAKAQSTAHRSTAGRGGVG